MVSVEFLIDSFERLTDKEKKRFAVEVLRRVTDLELPALTDEELLMNADTVFLELDQQELSDGVAQTR